MYGLKLNLLKSLFLIFNVSFTACIVPGHFLSVNVLNDIIEFFGINGTKFSNATLLGSYNRKSNDK